MTDDAEWVRRCLGREPRSRYAVVARDASGRPSVIRNEPLLDDGTPMPTRYWLIDPDLSRRIGTLEAAGGVDAAEADLGLDRLEALHRAYADERDASIDPSHPGPRPFGGVGGTRVGVKCLHAHVAHLLAGGDDPVGRWVLDRLAATAATAAPAEPAPAEPAPAVAGELR